MGRRLLALGGVLLTAAGLTLAARAAEPAQSLPLLPPSLLPAASQPSGLPGATELPPPGSLPGPKGVPPRPATPTPAAAPSGTPATPTPATPTPATPTPASRPNSPTTDLLSAHPSQLAAAGCACETGQAGRAPLREAPLPPPGRFYLDADYLLWFSKTTRLPPLVLQGGPGDQAAVPAVGQPGTTVLIGDQDFNGGIRSGMQLRLGWWCDEAETVGVEVSGFYLENAATRQSAVSLGNAALGLSYADPDFVFLNPETSLLLSTPGSTAGTALVETSGTFWGAAASGVCHVTGGRRYRADALYGFRYLRLTEDASQVGTSTALPGGQVMFQGFNYFAPASSTIRDHFRTTNDFYGGQLGAHVLCQNDIWFADFRASLAAGLTAQTLKVDGSTTLSTPGSVTTVPGGLLAQASNMGTHRNNRFTIVPEAGGAVGCQLTDWLRASVGYSIVYMRQAVIRPGTEIDHMVNSTSIPTFNPAPLGNEPHPAVKMKSTDFWAQGVVFSVELDF